MNLQGPKSKSAKSFTRLLSPDSQGIRQVFLEFENIPILYVYIRRRSRRSGVGTIDDIQILNGDPLVFPDYGRLFEIAEQPEK